MDLNKLYIDLTKKKFTDVEIKLVGRNNAVTIAVHRTILAISSDYFHRLFTFANNKKSSYTIQVDDANIAYDIIMSFYKQSNYPLMKTDNEYILKLFKCRSYFCLDNDIMKLYNLKISPFKFELLIEVISNIDFVNNSNLMRTVKNNIPNDYDVTKFTKEFAKLLLDVNKLQIASCNYSNSIKIWDIETKQCIKKLRGHTDEINSIAISTDNSIIISGSDDSTIKIWDILTGKCLQTLINGYAPVLCVAISPDKTKIASGYPTGRIIIWKLTNIDPNQPYQFYIDTVCHYHWVRSIVFSHDSSKFVSGSDDHTAKIFDAETGECLQNYCNDGCYILTAIFSHDDSRIITGNSYHKIKIYDVNTGICLKTLKGHTDRVRSVAISMDDTKIISGSTDKTIKIWDISTGECLHTLVGNTKSVKTVIITPNDECIISSSIDANIKIWDMHTGQCLQTLNVNSYNINSIALILDQYQIDKKLRNYLISK